MDFYKCNLNTYKYPPMETCTIPELDEICKERLQLFKIMDVANNSDLNPNTKKWEEYVESEIMKNNLKNHIILLNNEEFSVRQRSARRNDHIAHWLLSLCYCRTNTLRNFFMCCELYWFIMLYKRMKTDDLNQFLAENEFNYKPVTQSELNLHKNNLLTCRNVTNNNFCKVTYFKAKFSEITNLVRTRQVFLCKGYAYFPDTDVIYCVKTRLWEQFATQLLWTNKTLPTNIQEDRIQDFLQNMPVVTPTVRNYIDEVPVVTLDKIDEVAEAHYPLCMRTIHDRLRTEHHLKYDCKMQYGIFLKCLGLTYEDAMEFWRKEFTQKMPEDWFNRKYLYLFKYQYGMVGARMQYSPYSCKRILNMCPGPGQHHGCPFKHWDLDKLLKKCQDDGVGSQRLTDVERLVGNNKFQEACTLYFGARNNVVREEVFESPNQYFKDSYGLESSLQEYFDDVLGSSQSETL